MPLTRYARLQVDADSIPDDDKPPQTGHTFNIWFLKWAGGDSSNRNLIKSKFRVNIKKDSGITRGVDGKSPICVFFARGCCYKGKKCPFLHRLPAVNDSRIPTQDCFGRDKTADYRDDMGGVGSLSRNNRTIFVTGIHINDSIQETLHRHFSEFGAVDKIRVLHAKNCAFVSYRLEAEAQFAKEAMDAQTLDGKDVLCVKWANDDPNPQAQQSAKREMEDTAMQTVKRLLKSVETGNDQGNLRKMKKKEGKKTLEEIKEKNGSTGSTVSGTSQMTREREEHWGFLGSSRISALRKLQQKRPQEIMEAQASVSLKKDLYDKKTDKEPNGSLGLPVHNASAFSGYSSEEDSD